MARERRPLFLRPEPYRHRRLIDAARLIPVFGAFLLIVPPMLLPADQTGATSSVVIYLFGLWTILIVLAALIARHLMATLEPRREHEPPTASSSERDG